MRFRIFSRSSSDEEKRHPEKEAQKGNDFRGKIVKVYDRSTALNVSACYRAIDVLSQSLAQVPISMMRYDKSVDCYVKYYDALGGRLNYLLQVKPNERQNALHFWREVWQGVYCQGNSVIWLKRDSRGEVIGLYNVGANNTGLVVYDILRNSYTLSDSLQGINEVHVLPEDVIHLRNTYTRDGYIGESTISYANRALTIGATSDQQTLDNVSKGGRHKIIIQQKHDGFSMGRYGRAEMQEAVDNFGQQLIDRDVSYAPEGNLTTVSQSAADQQLLQGRQFGVSEISRFFGVPRVLLMDNTNVNYRTNEATQQELKSTLAPRLAELCNELDSKLVGVEGYGRLRFMSDMNVLGKADVKTQCEVAKVRLETGQASVNELRKESNMPKVKDGDDHYVSMNVGLIGSEKLSK